MQYHWLHTVLTMLLRTTRDNWPTSTISRGITSCTLCYWWPPVIRQLVTSTAAMFIEITILRATLQWLPAALHPKQVYSSSGFPPGNPTFWCLLLVCQVIRTIGSTSFMLVQFKIPATIQWKISYPMNSFSLFWQPVSPRADPLNL